MNTLTCPNPFAPGATVAYPPLFANEPKISADSLAEELEFLWQDCDLSGDTYDLYLGRISRSPIVRNHATGKYFMLPWSRIIELAVARDADKARMAKSEAHAKWGVNE